MNTLVLCVMFCRSLFVLFVLAIMFSVLLQFRDSSNSSYYRNFEFKLSLSNDVHSAEHTPTILNFYVFECWIWNFYVFECWILNFYVFESWILNCYVFECWILNCYVFEWWILNFYVFECWILNFYVFGCWIFQMSYRWLFHYNHSVDTSVGGLLVSEGYHPSSREYVGTDMIY
jgi:hypothetical protein